MLIPGRWNGFAARLEEALAVAEQRRTLSVSDVDTLLLDPEFDAAAFEEFRQRLEGLGIALPEETERHPAHAPRGGERDLLDVYLDEIGRIPLLEHAELLALAFRSRAGDEDARRRIILANLRLVVHIARAYRNRGLPLLDVIEEGNLGLIHSVDRFEPERGLRFSTYASIWIRQSILRGIAEQARSVRIPVQMFQQVLRFARVERMLNDRYGRPPSLDEVAHSLEISTGRAERLASLVAGLRSLDEGSNREAFERLSLEDLGEAPPSVETLVDLQLQHEKVDRLMRSLSQREEQILRIRYGFHDGVARSLAQTGEHFGITRERVRQIEARALEKLRRALELHSEDGRFVPREPA